MLYIKLMLADCRDRFHICHDDSGITTTTSMPPPFEVELNDTRRLKTTFPCMYISHITTQQGWGMGDVFQHCCRLNLYDTTQSVLKALYTQTTYHISNIFNKILHTLFYNNKQQLFYISI